MLDCQRLLQESGKTVLWAGCHTIKVRTLSLQSAFVRVFNTASMKLIVIIVFPFGIRKCSLSVFSSMNNLCISSVSVHVRGFFAGLGCSV